jgi:predicted Zn-dependent protease
MRRTVSGSWLVLMLAAAGCGSAPVSQAVFGPAQARAGAETAKGLEDSGALLSDPKLLAYVRAVGSRLVQAAPAESGPFRFEVVDMGDPNAFALPGGHVYVSRGLLVLLNSEDELAGALGHEIGHIVARHHVKEAAHDAPFIPLRIATGLGGALLSIVSPTLGGMLAGSGRFTSELFHAPYSRDQESEADDIGQRLAAASGWDPLGISHVMDSLGADARLHGGDPQRRSFLASHPASAERSARTRTHASRLERASTPPLARGREEFLEHLDGLVVGPGAKQGIFEGQDFRHPELGFGMRVPTPPEWKQANTPEMVAAVREAPDAAVLLELVAKGDDPGAAAREHRPGGARLESEPEAATVNGLPAVRARAALQGRFRAELWWIALGGQIYRITSLAGKADFETLAPVLTDSARSFHALTPGERASIREDRLRIERARTGDALDSVLQRSGSRWTAEQAGAANALAPDAALSAGQLVKVTRPEPYE